MLSIGIHHFAVYFAKPDAIRGVTPLFRGECRIVTRAAWRCRCNMRSDASDDPLTLARCCADGPNTAFRIRTEIPCPLCKQLDRRFAEVIPHVCMTARHLH